MHHSWHLFLRRCLNQEKTDSYLYNLFLGQIDCKDVKTLTVLDRLKLRENKSGTHLLENLIGECKKIRDGVSLVDLSAEEAAKRLAIGTQVGKYHNKALQMRGLQESEYLQFKEEFIKKLESTKLNPESKQESSFILLQNQK